MKTKKEPKAEIGIIGGSGFYSLLDDLSEVSVKTPYGSPSDKIAYGLYRNKKVAFLPRHGKKHQYPPHKIPYRANIWAFKNLGVKEVIVPCAVGSLNPVMKPSEFVICDQFINFTSGRKDTFFDGPRVAHVSSADPYCAHLRRLALGACQDLKIKAHKKGTIAVINGPRFSTRAESRFFSSVADLINMTAYPEMILARELGMCYINIALITDYDAGVVSRGIKPVSAQDVVKTFRQNNERVKNLILRIIQKASIKEKDACDCESLSAESAFIA
jgi:5'-methylthioadenosine phosphorylase